MHLLQTRLDIYQRQTALLYIVQQPAHFALRRNQACQIHPVAGTRCAVRTKRRTYLCEVMPLFFLQTADQAVA